MKGHSALSRVEKNISVEYTASAEMCADIYTKHFTDPEAWGRVRHLINVMDPNHVLGEVRTMAIQADEDKCAKRVPVASCYAKCAPLPFALSQKTTPIFVCLPVKVGSRIDPWPKQGEARVREDTKAQGLQGVGPCSRPLTSPTGAYCGTGLGSKARRHWVIGLLLAFACLLSAKAAFGELDSEMRFVEPEKDLPPDWGNEGEEEEEWVDPDWAEYVPERPPPVTALPRLWSLPLKRGNRGSSLYDLVTEYVYRKFVVLADLTDWSSANPQGTMNPDAWTQLKAIDGMLASLGLPK